MPDHPVPVAVGSSGDTDADVILTPAALAAVAADVDAVASAILADLDRRRLRERLAAPNRCGELARRLAAGDVR